MTRTWKFTWAALAVAASLPAGAAARATAGDAQAPPQRYVVGTVAESARDHLVVDGVRKGMLTLRVNDRTRVTLDGKRTTARRLQVGSPVFAAYAERGDRLVATRVQADPPRMSAGPLASARPLRTPAGPLHANDTRPTGAGGNG